MTEADLIRKIDESITRHDAMIARMDRRLEGQAQAFDTMTQAFQTFLRVHNRLEQKFDRRMDNLEADVRAMRDALLTLIDRLTPPAADA